MAALEETLGMPVVGMESPRGINDPALGAFAEVLAQADLLVLLGKPLDFTLRFGAAPALAPDCRFVIVDPDPALLAPAPSRTASPSRASPMPRPVLAALTAAHRPPRAGSTAPDGLAPGGAGRPRLPAARLGGSARVGARLHPGGAVPRASTPSSSAIRTAR